MSAISGAPLHPDYARALAAVGAPAPAGFAPLRAPVVPVPLAAVSPSYRPAPGFFSAFPRSLVEVLYPAAVVALCAELSSSEPAVVLPFLRSASGAHFASGVAAGIAEGLSPVAAVVSWVTGCSCAEAEEEDAAPLGLPAGASELEYRVRRAVVDGL